MREHGLLGGWYAFEVSYNSKDDRYNVHIHIYARYTAYAGWLILDNIHMKNTPIRSATFTPAYIHILNTWLDSMYIYARMQYDKLPHHADFLQPWQVDELRARGLRHDKYISADIGGRRPNTDRPHHLKIGEQVDSKAEKEAREAILKYLCKELKTLPEENQYFMVPIMRAFNGQRRCQPFGDLYNVAVSEAEIREEIEKAGFNLTETLDTPRYTGRILTTYDHAGMHAYIHQFSERNVLHMYTRANMNYILTDTQLVFKQEAEE